MVFDITNRYVDPGPYFREVVSPSGVNIGGQAFATTLIGTGSRNKRIVNEQLLRAAVEDEALTVSSTVSAHYASLAVRGNRSVDATTVTQTLNSIAQSVPVQYITYNAPFILGTVTATQSLAALKAFSLSMDGKPAVQIILIHNAAPSTVVNGAQVLVRAIFSGSGGISATIAEIVAAINTGLAALAAAADPITGLAYTIYDTSYAGAASVSGGAIKITSPNTGATADVNVFAGFANDGITALFGAAAGDRSNREARTVLNVGNSWYNSSATYTATYVGRDPQAGFGQSLTFNYVDALANADVQSIVSVGNYPSNGTYVANTDFVQASDTIDWTPGSSGSAFILGTVAAVADLSTNFTLTLNVDGKGDVAVNVNGTAAAFAGSGLSTAVATAINGYVLAGTMSAATQTEIALNINAVMANDPRYGARYASVASVSSSKQKLTSPITNSASAVTIKASAATDLATTTAVYGLTSLPSMDVGDGKRPAAGSLYYVTYDYTRADSEYNVIYRFTSPTTAKAQVGGISASTPLFNPLAQAVDIAFGHGANLVYIVQVDDTALGNPSRSEVKAGLDAAGTLDGLTEIVVMDEPGTRLDVTLDMVAHLEDQNSPIVRHYRRTWHGMSAGTSIGDVVTSDTFINRARATLQVTSESPGRGRMFLLAPPQESGISIDLTLDDGNVVRRTVDSTYLAVAVAAMRTALLSPSDTLVRKTLRMFNVDDITAPWSDTERGLLAAAGVTVVTADAGGRLILLDPISTEGGGQGLIQFKQDSSSTQKDVLFRSIRANLDASIIGIVPFDLASFIIDIKLVIANAISAAISAGQVGPYRSDSGSARPIDLRRDIAVQQSTSDPTKFYFQVWWNLRYPAKYLFGEIQIDTPFLSSSANQ